MTNYRIRNKQTLTKLLWSDTFLGGITALLGLLFTTFLSEIMGLSNPIVIFISAVTLVYAIFAFVLANQKNTNIRLLRVLVAANWLWTIVSIGLLYFHFNNALILGKIFLILQILVVGGLAYLEGEQIINGRK